MGVKKVFIILITVVVCVLLGAIVLNMVMPNLVSQLSNQIETQIYNATGLSFNFNGDSKAGGKSEYDAGSIGNNDGTKDTGTADKKDSGTVGGFESQGSGE